MKVKGRVVDGRIEVEDGVELPEGATVEVSVAEEHADELTDEEDEELWQRQQEIERGEFVTVEELLAEMRSRHQPR